MAPDHWVGGIDEGQKEVLSLSQMTRHMGGF
jgi:hypothetical protein